jgi:phosphoribosylformylglycinamidine synthase
MTEAENKELEFSIDMIPEPEDISEVIYSLMVNPNLSTINYFNDFSEQGATLESIGASDTDETGLFELDSNGTRMAMSTHAFHNHLEIDPKIATEILVSRATRKMLCLGATPTAISAFLYHIDFADPNGQFIASGAKKGLEETAERYGLKITDRKIRFDKNQNNIPVPPTIIISMMAQIENEKQLTTHCFKNKGNNIFVIGRSKNDINSSEYLEFYHGINNSPLPDFNIDEEVKIQETIKNLTEKGLVDSASPIGKGGLFFTLLRAAFPNNLGFDITTDAEVRTDAFLFGEAMGRLLVGVNEDNEELFVDTMTELGLPFFMLGHVTRGEIRVDDQSLGFIDKMNIGA